jgi:hypothetical protein
VPADALLAAMSAAVDKDLLDPQVVLIEARRHAAATVAPVVPIGALARYDRPAPSLAGYDELLSGNSA